VAASIQIAQEGDRREKTSLSRRSPVARPDFASSPTISTADVTSSVPPGGWTGPRARSASLSKPCLGTDARARADPAGRLEALALRRLAGELAAAFGLLGRLRAVVAPAACDLRVEGRLAGAGLSLAVLAAPVDERAAARRGLVRPGRVRGRFARTLSRSSADPGRPSLWFGPLMRTSLLNAGPRRLQNIDVPSDISGRRVSMTAWRTVNDL